jgi:hypothetical protein
MMEMISSIFYPLLPGAATSEWYLSFSSEIDEGPPDLLAEDGADVSDAGSE